MATLSTIEAQLQNTIEVIEHAHAELRLFKFHNCSDALAQLKGEVQWIRDKVKEMLKEQTQ